MINIELNLGKVALLISCAGIKADKQIDILKKGIASEAYRAVGSSVFGEDMHDRKEPYSDALALEVKNAGIKILSQYCDNLEIETSPRKAGKEVLTVEKVLAGLSEADLTAMLAKKQAEKAAPKAAEVVEEIEAEVSMG